MAPGLEPDVLARINFQASVRRHVRPRLPEHYLDNTAVTLSVAAAVSDIVCGSLASVADEISSSIDRLKSDDFAQSVIERGTPAGNGSLPATDLRVVSWLGMPSYGANFGWGTSEFMGRVHLPMCGSVDLTSGPANDGSVRMAVCLEPASIKVFDKLLHAMF